MHGLAPRQLEVARLVAQGLRNQEIAERLFIAHNTVKTHLRVVFAKLRVRNRVELARLLDQLDAATPPQRPGGGIAPEGGAAVASSQDAHTS